jgi:hypothetical protein
MEWIDILLFWLRIYGTPVSTATLATIHVAYSL